MLPPKTEAELLERARSLAGRTLRSVAEDLAWPVPADLRRDKGFVGALLEAALGATGGPAATWDFPALRVELKTVPVDARGRPRESTCVCAISLGPGLLVPWRESWVRAKLARVLWVPVRADGAPAVRVVGTAGIWSPSPEEDAVLEADWDEISTRLGLGDYAAVDARFGAALQVRPKAADGRSRQWALNDAAEWVPENPRGFYLRARFTARVLAGLAR